MDSISLILLTLQIVVLSISYAILPKKINEKFAKNLGLLAALLIACAMLMTAWNASHPIDILLIAVYSIWLLGLARLFNLKNTLAYVKHIVKRDSQFFFVITTIILLLSVSNIDYEQAGQAYIWSSVFISLLMVIVAVISLQKYKYDFTEEPLKHRPTVTLAIPARNETHALKQNLEVALTSNYEKLEILVLDDCSQDGTAEVIRKFAHDGVRFVQGAEPSESWIGKNQAYKTLLEQASGEVVIFSGVDVHLSVDAVSQIIKHMEDHELSMVSVLPTRISSDPVSHILQPMRYFWQLALPRFATTTPNAISSFWAVNRSELIKHGGFDSVKNSMSPELVFAKKFNEAAAYQYIVADEHLDITTKKRPNSQVSTAVRTSYPSLRRSYALSALAIAAILLTTIVPYLAVISAAINAQFTPAYVTVALLTICHMLMLQKIAPRALISSPITLPLSMMAQACLIAVSAWQYEFGDVTWKGRNVCMPKLVRAKN